MNKSERDEIRRRCEKTTPGPWEITGARYEFITRREILELLDAYDELESDRDKFKTYFEEQGKELEVAWKQHESVHKDLELAWAETEYVVTLEMEMEADRNRWKEIAKVAVSNLEKITTNRDRWEYAGLLEKKSYITKANCDKWKTKAEDAIWLNGINDELLAEAKAERDKWKTRASALSGKQLENNWI